MFKTFVSTSLPKHLFQATRPDVYNFTNLKVMPENPVSSCSTSQIVWLVIGHYLTVRGGLAVLFGFVALYLNWENSRIEGLTFAGECFCVLSGLAYFFIGVLINVYSKAVEIFLTGVILVILTVSDILSVIAFLVWHDLTVSFLISYLGVKMAGMFYLFKFANNQKQEITQETPHEAREMERVEVRQVAGPSSAV